MAGTLQIILGLTLGLAGFLQISSNPAPACSVALIGGLLVLEGVNRSW